MPYYWLAMPVLAGMIGGASLPAPGNVTAGAPGEAVNATFQVAVIPLPPRVNLPPPPPPRPQPIRLPGS